MSSVMPLNCHFTIVNLANISFESMEKFKHLGVTQRKENCIHTEIKSKINMELKEITLGECLLPFSAHL
jgi:hypothetical protein